MRDPLLHDDLADKARRFHALFLGSEKAHGVFPANLAPRSRDSKQLPAEGEHATTPKGEATSALWARHLAGDLSIGVIPIRSDGTCIWGAIDVDDYTLSHADLYAKIEAAALPLVVCRSKSGGAHLFLFLNAPTPVATVIAALEGMAAQLSLPYDAVFPKQEELNAAKKVGNWLNMPYFAGDESDRYGVGASGKWTSAAEFLDVAEAARIPASALAALTAPAPDARRQDRSATGGSFAIDEARLWLADAARRLAAVPRGQSLGNKTLNGMLVAAGIWGDATGLTEEEVEDALRQAWMASGRTSSDFSKCFPRSFRDGLAKGASGETPDPNWRGGRFADNDGKRYPVFESITRVEGGEDVMLEIKLGGHEKLLELPARYLSRHQSFVDACVEQLSTSFHSMKNDAWTSTYLPALEAATTRRLAEDETMEGEFFRLLQEFCTMRGGIGDRYNLMAHHPWEDDESSRTYFVFADLRRHFDMYADSRFKGRTRLIGQMLNRIGRGEVGGDVGKTTLSLDGRSIEVRWVSSALFQPLEKLPLPRLPNERI